MTAPHARRNRWRRIIRAIRRGGPGGPRASKAWIRSGAAGTWLAAIEALRAATVADREWE